MVVKGAAAPPTPLEASETPLPSTPAARRNSGMCWTELNGRGLLVGGRLGSTPPLPLPPPPAPAGAPCGWAEELPLLGVAKGEVVAKKEDMERTGGWGMPL